MLYKEYIITYAKKNKQKEDTSRSNNTTNHNNCNNKNGDEDDDDDDDDDDEDDDDDDDSSWPATRGRHTSADVSRYYDVNSYNYSRGRPLCHFYFAHPFRVGDVYHGTLPLSISSRSQRLPRRRSSLLQRPMLRSLPPASLRWHRATNGLGASDHLLRIKDNTTNKNKNTNFSTSSGSTQSNNYNNINNIKIINRRRISHHHYHHYYYSQYNNQNYFNNYPFQRYAPSILSRLQANLNKEEKKEGSGEKKEGSEKNQDVKQESQLSHRSGGKAINCPSLEDVLWSIRDAWPPPRSLSADSESMCSSNFQDMGSGNCLLRGGLLLSNGIQSNLPHRRFSVPETVMRKFTLSRERSSESCGDSEVATMPTPSVSSNGLTTDRSAKGAGPHPSRQRREKHVDSVSKACQTSPRQSQQDLRSGSQQDLKEFHRDSRELRSEEEVRAESVDSNMLPTSTTLDLKQWEQSHHDSNEDNSTKDVETSPEFFLDTARESKMISEITLPGEVVLDDSRRQSSMDVSSCVEDAKVGSKEKKLLLEQLNQQELRKIYTDNRSKSFADGEVDSSCGVSTKTAGKRLVKSAKSRLLQREASGENLMERGSENQDTPQGVEGDVENNNDTEMDSAVLEDDTPSPPPQNNEAPSNSHQNHHHHHHRKRNSGDSGSSNNNNNYKSNGSPPKSGQSSESADCYITDCDICTAEGRKCCSLDDSSEVCSFTSPDIVMTTNELKTTSDFTSTSVTLCQTVSDRSSSTQDSTLSITSITPESYSTSENGKKKKNGETSPTNLGLVITSETAIIDPVDTRLTSKNSPFHLSHSSQSDNQSSASNAGIPLVLTSESVLIDPVEQEVTKKMHCVLEMMETDESSLTDNTQIEKEVFEVPDAGEIFEDRSVDHRQSTGSIITTPVRRDVYSRSMSCGELPANYEGQSGDENDEGDLLKELGFKEEPKSGRTSVSFLELCGSSRRDPTYEETCRRKVNNMFYGNRTYEVMTSTSDCVGKKTTMGNVMSTCGENVKIMPRLPLSDRQSVEVGVDLVRNDSEEKNESTQQHEVVCDGTCNDKQDNETICGNVIMLRLPLHQTEDGKVLSTLEGPEIENFGADLIIPRYSAKPRTSSMVVNTSSADYSSDSELSMADSLEEVPQSQEETCPSSSDQQGDVTSRSAKNRHDERLVRGHVISLLPENNTKLVRQRTTEAYAYFVTLTGEMSEIRTESIPENLKKKLMERDSELKKHSDHHTTKREKRYESIFKRPIARRTPKLSKLSKSEYRESFFKPDQYMNRRAYSLTSEDSEDVAVECKSTQWEENPVSEVKNLQNEEEILRKTKESKWLKCKQLIKSTPELDKVVSEVILSTLLQDMKDDEVDEEIKNILLEALKENEELAKLEFNEEQVVPSKEERDSVSDEEEVIEDGKYKCISVQTNESTLHSILTCSYEACDICNEIHSKNMKDKRDVAVGVERKSSKEQKIKQKKNKENVVQKNDVRIKMPNISSHHQRCFISGETNLLEQMGAKGVVVKEEPKKVEQQKDNMRTPSPGGRTALNINYRPPSRNSLPPSKPQVRLKLPISRRSGNFSSRFHQRFEAIPEERSGSLESGEEMKSPKDSLPRRASAPSDMLLLNTKEIRNDVKSTTLMAPELDSLGSSSSSGNGRETILIERGKRNSISNLSAKSMESLECVEGNVNSRRHTIHSGGGDFSSGKTTPTEKSRRHTVHGTIGLSSTGKINLNVGSIMKGRLIGKRGNVMIGRFHPVSPSEETQVEKDEKLLIGKIERVARERHKGRDALATTPRGGSEHSEEELLTLSKGWINFYLLRESMDIGGDELGSDGEMSGSGSEDPLIGDEDQCTVRSMKKNVNHRTVTVVGEPEEQKIRQYTMKIHASEEQDPQTSISPLQLPPSSRSENRLPHITSPTMSSASDGYNTHLTTSANSQLGANSSASLPLLGGEGKSRPILKHSKVRTSTSTTKKFVANGKEAKFFSSPTQQTESRVEYLQFPLGTLDNRSPSGDSLITASCDTESDSMSESPVLPSIRWPVRQVQQRNRYHQCVQRYQRTETKSATCQLPPQTPNVIGSHNGSTCWTVTVTGNGGDPQQPPPDVEMRLSFGGGGATQKTPQDATRTRSAASSLMQPESSGRHKRLKRALQSPVQPCWSLSVKNKNEEEQQELESDLPGLGSDRHHHTGPNSYKTPKKGCETSATRQGGARERERERETSHFAFVWPKVEQILAHGPHSAQKTMINGTSLKWNSCSSIQELSVTGLAITPEKKPRVPTMSERDLTRMRNKYL